METRIERVVLETPRHPIIGDVTMPRDGYRSRLSDFLNYGELDFIPLVNVEVSGWETPGSARRDFIAVARTHVQVAYPVNGAVDLEPGEADAEPGD